MLNARNARECAEKVLLAKEEEFKQKCEEYLKNNIIPEIQKTCDKGLFVTYVVVNEEKTEEAIISQLLSLEYRVDRTVDGGLKISW